MKTIGTMHINKQTNISHKVKKDAGKIFNKILECYQNIHFKNVQRDVNINNTSSSHFYRFSFIFLILFLKVNKYSNLMY